MVEEKRSHDHVLESYQSGSDKQREAANTFSLLAMLVMRFQIRLMESKTPDSPIQRSSSHQSHECNDGDDNNGEIHPLF